MVTVLPGIAESEGAVNTTVPLGGRPLSTSSSLTLNPARCRREVASLAVSPLTCGIRPRSLPFQYSRSIGGSRTGPNLVATGFTAWNHVRAGSIPPNTLPS